MVTASTKSCLWFFHRLWIKTDRPKNLSKLSLGLLYNSFTNQNLVWCGLVKTLGKSKLEYWLSNLSICKWEVLLFILTYIPGTAYIFHLMYYRILGCSHNCFSTGLYPTSRYFQREIIWWQLCIHNLFMYLFPYIVHVLSLIKWIAN